MGFVRGVLMRMFGRPRGVLGRLGGLIMARANAGFGGRAAGLLGVQPGDSVLEVGFGPGVVIERLSRLAAAGRVAGVDPSREMVRQARARNAAAVRSCRVDLWHGSVHALPFGPGSFDKALAVNSMQVWPDPACGLREIGRVLRPGGRIALGFTPRSGQRREGLIELLRAAGFAEVRLVEVDGGFCVLASKPWPGDSPPAPTSSRPHRRVPGPFRHPRKRGRREDPHRPRPPGASQHRGAGGRGAGTGGAAYLLRMAWATPRERSALTGDAHAETRRHVRAGRSSPPRCW